MKNLFILLLFVFSSACANKNAMPPRIPNDSISVHDVQMAIWALPFKHKDIVLAQAILETGWFKSKNFMNNNNLFGMRQPHTRMTTSDTAYDGYAHYTNWQQSVIDYYLLQSTTETIYPRSREQYYHYLDKTYSEVGISYSSQLKDILSRLDLDTEQCKEENHTHKKVIKHSAKKYKSVKHKHKSKK
jgi:hypothetical protein